MISTLPMISKFLLLGTSPSGSRPKVMLVLSRMRSKYLGNYVQRRARNDDFSIKSATKLGAVTPIRIRRHERRPIHRISASRLQQSARPFCFVAAALACFCAACFRVDFGDLAPLCLITTLGFADASLVSASIILVRGSQIGKTKLSVRKAEERP
jgi:hypothetical protein